jgi:hypothetical protein
MLASYTKENVHQAREKRDEQLLTKVTCPDPAVVLDVFQMLEQNIN